MYGKFTLYIIIYYYIIILYTYIGSSKINGGSVLKTSSRKKLITKVAASMSSRNTGPLKINILKQFTQNFNINEKRSNKQKKMRDF